VTYARTVYEYQEFNFHGDCGDNGWLEDYTTHFHGQPAGVVVTVARNAAGQAQHVIVNHRPRGAVLLLARLCGEKFAGAPPLPSSSSPARPEGMQARRTRAAALQDYCRVKVPGRIRRWLHRTR
jgi:hypothetical protein